MQSLLHKVNQLLREEKILKREKERRGENYNVFEVMNVQSDEVNTHSAIIASLLNPRCNHGCKSSFLKIFVDNVKEFLPNTDFKFETDLEKCHVEVEYNIGRLSSDSETGGRIDIIIESERRDKAIIIENKIYAGDQYKQLYRYKNYADSRYNEFIILYLTLDGHEPSEGSTCGKTLSMNDGTYFYCLGYNSFIRDWLISCKEKAVSHPVVRETITQYYNLITRLTNQDMESSTNEELVNLLADKDNISAMFNIMKVRNDVLNKVCNTTLKKQVQDIANELGMHCTCSTNNWCERWSGQFFFSKPEWKHFCIGFEFMGKNLTDFNYGVRYAGESEKGKYLDIREEIADRLKGSSNSWWVYYKPFMCRNWDNDAAFERLFDGSIKDEIKRNVENLCDSLDGIEL